MHTIEQLEEMLAEHKEWQGKINFYRAEIDRMKTDLASAVMADRKLDIMRHDFKQHENKIEAHSSNPVTNLAAAHQSEREKLGSFERYFKELRNEFQAFIHKEAFS